MFGPPTLRTSTEASAVKPQTYERIGGPRELPEMTATPMNTPKRKVIPNNASAQRPCQHAMPQTINELEGKSTEHLPTRAWGVRRVLPVPYQLSPAELRSAQTGLNPTPEFEAASQLRCKPASELTKCASS